MKPLEQSRLDPANAAGSPSVDFSTLYRDELTYVCNSLRRLGVQESDLEDLAHEVFLKVIRCYASYDPKRPFRPWLFGIALRTASDFRRLARHRRESRLPTVELALARDQGEESLAAEEDRKLVLRALSHLGLRRRSVFIMREIDGYSVAEIAQALELPFNTVYSRLRVAWREFERALRNLREPTDE